MAQARSHELRATGQDAAMDADPWLAVAKGVSALLLFALNG